MLQMLSYGDQIQWGSETGQKHDPDKKLKGLHFTTLKKTLSQVKMGTVKSVCLGLKFMKLCKRI